MINLPLFSSGSMVNKATRYLVKTSDGCQMITEEVVQDPGAVTFRDKDPSALHRGHEAWLKGLKKVSESQS